MANVKQYVGRGADRETATEDVYAVARKNGMTGDAQDMTYTCTFKKGRKTVRGESDADYGRAYDSMLSKAGVRADDLAAGQLEVTVKGRFEPVSTQTETQSVPKPSGAAPSAARPKKLTDLF